MLPYTDMFYIVRCPACHTWFRDDYIPDNRSTLCPDCYKDNKLATKGFTV